MAKRWNERLALWFGLSRASWLTLPRSMMVQMPDDWQERMAALLEEFDEEFSVGLPDVSISVSFKVDNKFVKIPNYINNYRHVNPGDFDHMRSKSEGVE